MKKFSWKKVLSLVLVAALTIGTLHWNGKAVKAENEPVDRSKVTRTTEDGIKITKEAKNLNVNGAMATVDIDITVEGAKKEMPVQTVGMTDVVFVLDCSNSMKGTPLAEAKEAAKAFATGLLTEENSGRVRIGVVSFSKTKRTTLALTDVLTNVTNTIDGLTNEIGTNIQAGICAAEDILKDSQATNKIIVILSDGAPVYSYQGTALNSEKTTLSDGSNAYLINSFNYGTIVGNGNYKLSYSLPLDTSFVIGWYDSNGVLITTDNSKVNYRSSYSSPLQDGTQGTYSVTKTYTAYKYNNNYYYVDDNNEIQYVSKNDVKNKNNNTGTYTKTITTSVVYKTGDVTISNNGIPTISEAQLAKNNGVVFYSIAYNVAGKTDAQYVMKNVASDMEKYYNASSSNYNTDDAIGTVLNSISEEINNDIAAATGTSLVDTFPSYMTAKEVSDKEKASIDSTQAGNKVNWSLSDLGEGITKTITITAEIDLNAMVDAYAASHTEYDNGADVKAALANGVEDIWFDLNKDLSITYDTYRDGEVQTVTDNSIGNAQGQIGVPQNQFTAYNYTVTYNLDGNEIANTKITGSKFAGETVTFADLSDYTNDTVKYDKDNTTTSLANNAYEFVLNANTDVEVNYYSNVFSVVYKDINGDEVKSFTDIKYGTIFNETVPPVPSVEGKENGRWSDDPSEKAITENWEIYPKYDDCKYTVTYEIYVDDVLVTSEKGAPKAATEILWGGNTALPNLSNRTYALNVDESTHKVTYKESDWTVSGSAIINIKDSKVTDIKSDVVVTKRFYSETQNATVYKVVNTGDDTSAKGWTGDYQWTDPQAPKLEGYSESTDNTDKFSYEFVKNEDGKVKWVKEEDGYLTIFTATRASMYIEYPVTFTFTPAEGKAVSVSENYHYDDTPSLPDELKVFTATADNDEWDYTYNKWPEFDKVTKSTSYEASETRVKKSYTYTFQLVVGSNEAITLDSGEVQYGTEVSAPSIDINNYAVTGSTINFTDYKEHDVTITGEYTDTAYITYSVNEYPVKITFIAVDEFGNEKPTQLMDKNVAYGEEVTFPSFEGYVETDTDEFDYSDLKYVGCNDNSNFLVEGPVEITIKQIATRKSYTVTFVIDDVDGKLTTEKKVSIPYGGDATAEAPELIEVADREAMHDTDGVELGKKYIYTVTPWDKAFNEITENITVTAKITKVEKTYTVNFEILRAGAAEAIQVGTFTTTYGAIVKAPVCMVTLNTDEFTYALTYPQGWTAGADFVVTDETAGTYTATETNVKNEYTISFVLKYIDGPDANKTQTIATVKVPYGTTATAPAIGAEYLRTRDAQWTYPEADTVFFEDYPNVVKNDTVVVEYKATLNNYIVTFVDDDNKELDKVTKPYGTPVADIVNGVNEPTKADSEDGHYTYEFAGWTEVKNEGEVFPETLDKNLTYKASYTATERTYYVYFVDEDGTYFDGRAPFTVAVTWGAIVPAEAQSTARNLAEQVAAKKTNSVYLYHSSNWMVQDENGKKVPADLGAEITKNLTVYASYVGCKQSDYKVNYYNADYATIYSLDAVEPGTSYLVKLNGPVKASSKTTDYTFVGWSYEKQYAPVEKIIDEQQTNAAEPVRTAPVMMLSAALGAPKDFGKETELRKADSFLDKELGTLLEIGFVDHDIDLYPVYTESEHLYTVTFVDYDGKELGKDTTVPYEGAATAPAAPSRAGFVADGYTYSYTFAGWDKAFDCIVEDTVVTALYNETKTIVPNDIPIIIPEVPGGDPTPTPTPTPKVTPEPTPEVTPEPTPEVVEVPEETETPEGTPEEVEIPEETETPEGTPEEEIEILPEETPQGLPKTGVLVAGVFYGIGSACIAIGATIAKRARRKEDEE